MKLALRTFLNAALLLSLPACATPFKGTLLGAGIGGGGGLIVGAGVGRNSQERALAIGVGALIGGTIGYFLSKEKIRQEQLKNTPGQTQVTPRLKKPEVRRLWVPDQIIGDEYVSGHWKFIIEKNSVWSN